MQSQKLSIRFAALLAISAVTRLVTATPAATQTEKVLHSFNYTATNKGPINPYAGLILDADGNLYGTTLNGGPNDLQGGTVFELSRMCGGWTEKTLHVFGNGKDGRNPYAGVISDKDGNLYGTTYSGGVYGQGTVFELSRTSDEGWTEKILHNFGGSDDGTNPVASLIFDAAGNLYGTATGGGNSKNCFSSGCGIVFELMPAEGWWTEKIIYNFGQYDQDGAGPNAGLVFDAHGNLYGTTEFCVGNPLCGAVFEVSPTADGGWNEGVLHFLGQGEGIAPRASLVIDGSGNLYGTTSFGGSITSGECGGLDGCGNVFELSPSTNGWTYTVLINFDFTDGAFSLAGLTRDEAGNLYGTTVSGGPFLYGNAFELSPTDSGGWTEKTLHNFGSGKDAGSPAGALIFDAHGDLYSTSVGGGDFNYGTVFEITP
jgi:uncharacterized repeat protein (TIGR03803 family)